MSNHQTDAPLQHHFDRGPNLLLCFGIHGGCRFIQHENLRIRQQRTGQRHKLLLSRGQTIATLANLRRVSIGKPRNDLRNSHLVGNTINLGIRRIQPAVPDVLPN